MQTYQALLQKFISFKTISNDTNMHVEMTNCVTWLKELFDNANFDTEIWSGYGNDILFANYKSKKPSAKTILIYGHYDVQPADLTDGWDFEPFELHESEDRLFARGVIDDKGQLLIHIYTILELLNQNQSLDFNIKFFIEGDEETGSDKLESCIIHEKDKLTADIVIVSDGELRGIDNPTISGGYRGFLNMSIKILGLKNDLHSGIYGGLIPNPAIFLTKALSDLINQDNSLNLPGFYEGIVPLTSFEETATSENIPTFEEIYELTGTPFLVGELGYNYLRRTGFRPTLQISGIKAGFVEDGYKNIIPATAEVKLNIRLVEGQNESKIGRLLEDYFLDRLNDFHLAIDVREGANATKINFDNKYFPEIERCISNVYKIKPTINYSGGSLPVSGYLKKHITENLFFLNLANEDCNMHGVNENFHKRSLQLALSLSKELFTNIFQ